MKTEGDLLRCNLSRLGNAIDTTAVLYIMRRSVKSLCKHRS